MFVFEIKEQLIEHNRRKIMAKLEELRSLVLFVLCQ
jgi:hypothetical protein